MTKEQSDLLSFYSDEGTTAEIKLLDYMIRIEHILKEALTERMAKRMTEQEFKSEVQRAHDMADGLLRALFIHTVGEGE